MREEEEQCDNFESVLDRTANDKPYDLAFTCIARILSVSCGTFYIAAGRDAGCHLALQPVRRIHPVPVASGVPAGRPTYPELAKQLPEKE